MRLSRGTMTKGIFWPRAAALLATLLIAAGCGNGGGGSDPLPPQPAITMVKTAAPTTYASVGAVIGYSYELYNTGNVALDGPFTVTDDKAAVTCPNDTTLAMGAFLTCTASYTITLADITAGSVTNTAQGHGSYNGNPVDSNTDSATVTATAPAPALTLLATDAPTTYGSAGVVIGYSYELTNTGNVPLAGPFTVTDDKAVVTCPADATLAMGAFLTCTGSYTTTQADFDAGSVTHTATGQGSFGGNPVNSNTAAGTVTATGQAPALTLLATDAPTTYGSAGTVIDYSYQLTNSGNVTLAGPFTVTDDKAAVTCPADATLAVGAFVTCTGSYTTTQADFDAGSVTHTATGHGAFNSLAVDSNTAAVTVTALGQAPALALVATDAPTTYASAGTVITFSYELTNSGNVTLAGPFTVTDDRAADESCPATATLAPGGTITCTGSYTTTQADVDAGSVTHTATGHGAFNANPVNSNTTTGTVSAAPPAPALALLVTASPTTFSSTGTVIGYSYQLTNSGNVTLAGPFTVTDDRAADEACPATATLAPGGTITCTGSYTTTQADYDAGSVTDTATGQGSYNATPVNSNTATATATATGQAPALALAVTAAPTTFPSAGTVIGYSYQLTNSGNVTLAGPFTVTDDRAADEACPATATLAPGGTITCTGSYTTTQADYDAGSVTDTATGHGAFGGNPVNSNTATATVTATGQAPALALAVTAAPTTFPSAGTVIGYSYQLTNSGNVTLAGPFTVTDDRAADEACPATATLAPGGTITCTGTTRPPRPTMTRVR